ncbi:Ribosome biogenesis regulatory protein-like protein [Hordeum vulgare]|nr:Ribosome biogenesis regulatory protein-like protein [Hordeum vulgare]
MRLKLQGEAIVQFDIACAKQREHADSKLEELKQEMELRLAKIEGLKVNVNESDKAAANANAMATETKLQLETAKATIDSLLSEGVWLQECLRSKDIELSESNLKEAQAAGDKIQSEARAGNANEIKPLRMALEVAEMRYQEEKTGIAFEIKTICEMLENVKSECMRQVCDIELKLKSKTNELMAAQGAPTGKVQEDLHMSYGLSEMQPELEAKLMKSITDIAELKANVMDKENAVQSLSEENDTLKSEAGRKEADVQQRYEAAVAELE